MSYNSTLPAFEQFSDTVNQAKNMKAHEIGEAILGFSTPILLKASEKGIAAWVKKRAHNLKVREQGARDGQPMEADDIPADVPDVPVAPAPAAEVLPEATFSAPFTEMSVAPPWVPTTAREMTTRAIQRPNIQQDLMEQDPEGDIGLGGTQPVVAAPATEFPAEAGIAQAQGWHEGQAFMAAQEQQQQPPQQPPQQPEIRAAAVNEGQDATPAVDNADDVAPVTAATDETAGAAAVGTLDELALDTSMVPELSTVFAVAGLIGSAIKGFIDIFKNHHVSPELENLRQIGV